MRYAVALSEHPDTGVALGEVVGQVLDRIGPAPDAAVLFLTGHHVDRCDELGRTVRQTLGARALIGGTAVSVLAHRQEVEETPGVVLWAGHTGPVRSFRPTPDGLLPDDLPEGGSVLVLADPYSYDAVKLAGRVPAGITLVGGLASAAGRPGGNRLFLDDEVQVDGAVALALPSELTIQPLVSQGCRPVGEPLTVTASEGNLVHELGGRPAMERLRQIAERRGQAFPPFPLISHISVILRISILSHFRRNLLLLVVQHVSVRFSVALRIFTHFGHLTYF